MKLLPLLLLPLTACPFVTDEDLNAFDADGDGYTVDAEGQGVDCDDHDPAVHTLTTFFVDTDADGWGNAAFSVDACTAPEGYVAVPGLVPRQRRGRLGRPQRHPERLGHDPGFGQSPRMRP